MNENSNLEQTNQKIFTLENELKAKEHVIIYLEFLLNKHNKNSNSSEMNKEDVEIYDSSIEGIENFLEHESKKDAEDSSIMTRQLNYFKVKNISLEKEIEELEKLNKSNKKSKKKF